MDLSLFSEKSPGQLIRISGADERHGTWEHFAFLVDDLPNSEPQLDGDTHRQVTAAARALATLNALSSHLPDPTLLRRPTLRREAQATSQLEGTTAPLEDVLMADADNPSSHELQEILNYEVMAEHAFDWVQEGRPITVGLLEDLQGSLMRNTRLEHESGRLRNTQVVIGKRLDADPREPRARQARFIPAPPGDQLRSRLEYLVDWMNSDHHGTIEPIIAAAMAHYQFEVIHPFRDGNGRLGRLLIVLSMMQQGLLDEPSFTVSQWLEQRRQTYYDALLGVSTEGNWNQYIRFFAQSIEASATSTHSHMLELINVKELLLTRLSDSPLRAATATKAIEFAVGNPSFTRQDLQKELSVTYARAHGLVAQLVELGILAEYIRPDGSASGRFYAPMAREVLLS